MKEIDQNNKNMIKDSNNNYNRITNLKEKLDQNISDNDELLQNNINLISSNKKSIEFISKSYNKYIINFVDFYEIDKNEEYILLKI